MTTLYIRVMDWWFDYSDRMYYKHTGTIWWRFWFEVTGQGRVARRYKRRQERGFKRHRKLRAAGKLPELTPVRVTRDEATGRIVRVDREDL